MIFVWPTCGDDVKPSPSSGEVDPVPPGPSIRFASRVRNAEQKITIIIITISLVREVTVSHERSRTGQVLGLTHSRLSLESGWGTCRLWSGLGLGVRSTRSKPGVGDGFGDDLNGEYNGENEVHLVAAVASAAWRVPFLQSGVSLK